MFEEHCRVLDQTIEPHEVPTPFDKYNSDFAYLQPKSHL